MDRRSEIGSRSKHRPRPRHQAGRAAGGIAGAGGACYLEWGLAVVILQFLISTSKQKHTSTAVLQREEEICLQITAHTSSKGALFTG